MLGPLGESNLLIGNFAFLTGLCRDHTMADIQEQGIHLLLEEPEDDTRTLAGKMLLALGMGDSTMLDAVNSAICHNVCA
jgi:hypothetical protein